MAEKEYIGLAVDGKILRVARLKKSGRQLVLHRLEEVWLKERMDLSIPADTSETDQESGPQEQSVFGLEEEMEGRPQGDLADDEDEVFDLTDEAEDDFEEPETNEDLLNNIFLGISQDRIDCAINVPIGATVYKILRETDYSKMKKKELRNTVSEQIKALYPDDNSSVNSTYEVQDDGSLLLSTFEGPLPLLQSIDRVEEYYSGKVFVQDILSDEMAMVGLIRENHILEEEEYTAIIQAGRMVSRVIFLKGENVYSILPLINEGTKSRNVMNTLFSKILLELDQENVPRLDRIILANISQEEHREYLSKQFPEITVESLQLDDNKIQISPNLGQNIAEYGSAIAMAWSGSGHSVGGFPDLSMVPDYVIDRQKVLKLEWHGIVLLVLIAMLPVVFNHFYHQQMEILNSLRQEKRLVWQQIEEQKPIKAYADSLRSELSLVNSRLAMLDTLSQGSLKWSKTLELISEGFEQVNSSWLTGLADEGDHIKIQGYTLYRNRIPRIANLFADVEIDDIVAEERRDAVIFRFSMTVNKVMEDSTIFNPSVELPEHLAGNTRALNE